MSYCCPFHCNNFLLFPTKIKPTFQYRQRHTHMLLSNADQLCMYAAGGATKHYSESIQAVGCAEAPASTTPTSPPPLSSLIKGEEHEAFLLLRRLFLHSVQPGSTGATRPDWIQKPSSLSGFSCSIWFQPWKRQKSVHAGKSDWHQAALKVIR